ncbi:MAG: serine hydrolase domain-containing protein [Pirellulaceae bacterium]|nr:serine hydrolase domain-containing protein [Pirellulaceae bacterium]
MLARRLLAVLLVASLALPLRGEEPAGPLLRKLGEFVESGKLSGVVALVSRPGKVHRVEAFGVTNLESKQPMQANTIFRIASMTKPIAATAVLILQDDGKLSVDDPVGKHLPEFNQAALAGGAKPARPVTIRDLLTHTSGVANPPAPASGTNPTLAEIVASIAHEPLQFEPGSQWKYGSGLTVAGRIVEVASGKSFQDFVEERICRPLKMKDTTFYPTAEQLQRAATIYKFDKEADKLVAVPPPVWADGEKRAPNPSGGLYSTALDYHRFLQAIAAGGELDGQRIVSTAAIKQMTSNQTGDLKAGFAPGQAWGLGWGTIRETTPASLLSPGSFGHGGAFGTQGWVDPARGAVLILMIARSDLAGSGEPSYWLETQKVAVELLK